MDDDQLIAALLRYEESAPTERPLPIAARARIEARIDRVFDDARSAIDARDDTVFEPIEPIAPHVTDRRRLVAGTVAAAAAVIVLVAAFVVLRPEEPEIPADQPIDPVPAALLEPGVRWSLATGLDPEPNDDAVSASVTVIVGDDLTTATAAERVVGATARISTSDVPPLQYLGTVQFVVEPAGDVHVPLVLLDPARPWVDCDATIDVAAQGIASCGADTVDFTRTGTRTDTVDTPIGRFDATGAVVDWTLDGSSSRYRTTIWSAPGVGPVRVDIDVDDTVRSYVLTEFDRPTIEPTGE